MRGQVDFHLAWTCIDASQHEGVDPRLHSAATYARARARQQTAPFFPSSRPPKEVTVATALANGIAGGTLSAPLVHHQLPRRVPAMGVGRTLPGLRRAHARLDMMRKMSSPVETAPKPDRSPRTPWFVALAAAWIITPIVLGFTLLTQIGAASDWLRAHPDIAVPTCIAVLAISTGFGLLPPYVQSIIAGWTFGVVTGTAAVLAGLLGGATIGFFVARALSGDALMRLIAANPRASAIHHALVEAKQRRTFLLILLLRLPPNSPFALFNLAMGAARVRYGPMIAATAIGMLPRTAFLCSAAAAAAATGAHDIQDLVRRQSWPWLIVGIGSFIAALLIIRVLAVRALRAAGLG